MDFAGLWGPWRRRDPRAARATADPRRRGRGNGRDRANRDGGQAMTSGQVGVARPLAARCSTFAHPPAPCCRPRCPSRAPRRTLRHARASPRTRDRAKIPRPWAPPQPTGPLRTHPRPQIPTLKPLSADRRARFSTVPRSPDRGLRPTVVVALCPRTTWAAHPSGGSPGPSTAQGRPSERGERAAVVDDGLKVGGRGGGVGLVVQPGANEVETCSVVRMRGIA